jgi:ABC-type multidrug transport system ATPase subunit
VSRVSEKVDLLRSVSGIAFPGECVAIIGGSGAGKTTLLDILAGRKHNLGELSGTVCYNGAELRQVEDVVKRFSAYVTQEDVFRGFLSVRETLSFFAELRLDRREFSREQREARVTEILSEV